MTELPKPTLGQIVLLTAEETGLPRSELNILMGHVLGLNRVAMIIRENDPLTFDKISEFKSLANRRVHGEPIAYITGQQEFYSRTFKVDKRVLIPRPETEELVERALAFLEPKTHLSLLTRVLDIGTGSGAIAVTLALENPLLEVTALDISEQALEVVKTNCQLHQLNTLRLVQSNLFDQMQHPVNGPEFDLIISNPPYIAAEDEHLSQGDLRFEPSIALTDGADGLEFYRALAAKSAEWLRDDGAVLVEHGFNQQEQIIKIFSDAGFLSVEAFKDLSGHPRMVMARIHTKASSHAP